jgi:branched-chain amino acid transport system substrate-binding protein
MQSSSNRLIGPALFAALLAASADAQAQGRDGPILLGAHLDVAKQASYYSILQRDTIDAFVKQLNAKGGVNGRPVNVLYEDDELNPVVAERKVEKLASQGVLAIFSISGSATGISAQAKADELKIPIFSSNTAERLTTSPPKPYYFRFGLRDSVAGKALADYIKAHKPAAKVALVRDGTESGLLISDGYIKELKNAGINIVAVEQINPGTADVTAQTLRVKDAGADYVVAAGASIPDLANYVKMHSALGNPAPLLGSFVFGTESFIRLTGKTSEGFIFTDVADFARPEAQAIEAVLLKEIGDRAKGSAPAVQTWELTRLITEGLAKAGLDRSKLREAVESTKDWPVALGPPGMKVTFGPDHHDLFVGGNEVVLREIRGGAFASLSKP